MRGVRSLTAHPHSHSSVSPQQCEQSRVLMSVQSMPTYWLCRHVYVCALPTATIFMDIKRNAYHAIAAADARRLAANVPGLSALLRTHACCSADGETDSETTALLCSLLQANLLTTSVKYGKIVSAPHLMHSVRDDLVVPTVERRPIRITDVLKFLAALTYAFFAARIAPLRYVIGHAQRKARTERMAARLTPTDQVAVLELVSIYRRIRVYLFGSRNNCLLQALSLRTFLTYYHIRTTWIFGVKMNPWSAHSWVQYGSLVLDGSPEEVQYYTPILVIPS